MTSPKKSCEMMCGCHVSSKTIVFCPIHENARKMAGMLDVLRKYFLETTGEESPFVKRIDTLIPRRDT